MIDIMFYILFGSLNISNVLATNSVQIPQYESGQSYNSPLKSSITKTILFTKTFVNLPRMVISNSFNDEDAGLNKFIIEARSTSITQFNLSIVVLPTLNQWQLNVKWLAIDDPSVCLHYVCLSPTPTIYTFTYTFNQTYPWFDIPKGAIFITGLEKLSFSGSTYDVLVQLSLITITYFTIQLPQDVLNQYTICLHSIFAPKEFLMLFPQTIDFNRDAVNQPILGNQTIQVALITVAPISNQAYLAGFTEYNFVVNDNIRLYIDVIFPGFINYWGPQYETLKFGVMRILYTPFNCGQNISPFLINSQNQCQCINGYLLNTQQYPYQCDRCNQDCLKCINNINFCQACSFPYTIVNTFGICTCIQGYILTSPQTCSKCQTPCLTCINVVTTCLSCMSGYYLQSSQCEPCKSPCLTCNSVDICTSCINGYYLLKARCQVCKSSCMVAAQGLISACIPQTYLSGIGNACMTCSRQIDQTSAVLCNTCIYQYYQDINSICLQCTLPCQTCVGIAETCTSCIPTTYLSNNACLQCVNPCINCTSLEICEICKNGYYLDANSACQSCTPPCQNCLYNAYSCTSCVSSTLLQNNVCICLVGYFLLNNTVCSRCQDGCASCENSQSCFNCISPQYYMQDNSCWLCKEPCQMCLPLLNINNQNSCLSCVNNLILIGYDCSCQDGSYLFNNICKLCDESCLKCTSIQCLQCKDQFKMVIQGTQCKCIDGYYYNNGQCSLCGYQCVQCNITSNYCTQCVNSLMTPINGLCFCIQGYYQTTDDNKCLKCNPQCSTCQLQSNNCTSCLFINSILNDGNCLCKDGYFMIADQQCGICQEQCFHVRVGVINNQCIICPPGCINCGLSLSNVNCNLCEQDFELINNQCMSNAQSIEISSQNKSFIAINAQQHLNQIYIQTNQINISIAFINMYQNNNLMVKIYYIGQIYISSICQITIDNVNSSQYSYQTVSNNETHAIIFNFTQTITSLDQMHIYICFQSDTLKQPYTQQFLITPNKFEFLNEQQKQIITKVQNAYSGFQISVLILTILSALFGGFIFILSICDIINWLSTFYYLNITYPYNVNFVFQTINLQQFMFLPSFSSNFNQQLDPYYFTSPYKFMQNQVDPLFMNNIINSCVLILSPLILFIFSKLYLKVEYQLEITSYIQTNKNKQYCAAIFSNIRIKALYFVRYYQAITLKQIHLNMLDLVMACSLQIISHTPNQYFIVLINTLAAGTTILLVLYLCYLLYQSARQDYRIHKTKIFKEQYQCIYENLKLRQFDQRIYGCIVLYSKILYIGFLVFCYDYPIIQTAACAGQYFLLIAYQFYVNPYSSLGKFCLEVIPNFCVFAVLCITAFLAVNEQIHLVQDLDNIGWIIISLICLSMMTQLYFVLKGLMSKIYNLLCKQD